MERIVKTGSYWLSRFADGEPALVAPHLRDRVESSLLAISEMSLASGDIGPGFWTELGAASRSLRPYLVDDAGVLHLPIRGVLLNGFPYQVGAYATGYEYIAEALDRGLSDQSVKGIALEIDSPGGMVAGNFDLVDDIHAARGAKPIRAFAAESAYSAAYSIASAADRIVVTRTGGVGSIGIVTSHLDASKAMDLAGFKMTFIYAGKHKVEGNQFQPLSDDAKGRIQARIDDLHGMFVETVARNRGISAAAVRATEALTYSAAEAIQLGLADEIGSLDKARADFASDLNPTMQKEGGGMRPSAATATPVSSGAGDYSTLIRAAAGKPEAMKIVEDGRAAGQSPAATALALMNSGELAQTEAQDRAVYSTNAALQREFATADQYVAFRGAERDGLVSVHGRGRVITGSAEQRTTPAPAASGGTEESWAAEFAGSAALQHEFGESQFYVAFKRNEARRR